MVDPTHSRACATRLRERAQQEDWPTEQTATAIHQCCGVSRLRAHRLAHGWTLRAAVERLLNLCAEEGLTAPKIDADQLGHWESNTHTPRATTVDRLCRLYRTDAHSLGLAGAADYRPHQGAPTTGPAPAVTPSRHLVAKRSAVPLAPAPEHDVDLQIEQLRRSVDRTLATGSVSSGQLDLIEERLLWSRQRYLYAPPTDILKELIEELSDVQALAAERQPASVQTRLSEMTAVLATLIADALMKLGNLRRSHAWYNTARTAADDSGNLELRARVRAQAAMLPYYYGPIEAAVSLTREARLMTRARPTATAAFAAAAEARALAQLGDAASAEHAIHSAQHAFEQCDPGADNDAFAFPARRLLLYLSGAYTALGHSIQARRVQEEALTLYPARTGIDPALLHLEAAICLAHERSPGKACQLACDTYLQVPAGHRTTILGARAQQVIDVLPTSARSARAVRELSDVLALPGGPM
ncbi:helix-turn-helix domain-containing protein [Streptomyces sp. QH1-20]|uniref:helix-turn-helix domain-containing protein n=1 Tax=Streptomyces sp. QH1-20 TaxID=3240934 RepID=UPI003515D7E7